MKRFNLVAGAVVLAASFGASMSAGAVEKADPPNQDGGGGSWGGISIGPGPGDPSLGGNGMPPGGDAAGVAAAERAEKAAERKRQAAERKKEEERQRREAEAKAQADKQKRIAAALAPKPYATAVTPIAAIASAPSIAASRRATLDFGKAPAYAAPTAPTATSLRARRGAATSLNPQPLPPEPPPERAVRAFGSR